MKYLITLILLLFLFFCVSCRSDNKKSDTLTDRITDNGDYLFLPSRNSDYSFPDSTYSIPFIHNSLPSFDNSTIKIYRIKKKHHVKLNEMWWNDKWPFNEISLDAFDLIKEIKGSDFNELNDFFIDSINYDYEAVTTLSPNHRIMFYNKEYDLHKEVLLAQSADGIGSLIVYPSKKNQGNKCWFLSEKASQTLWLKIQN
jgi:hypothetical protein